MSAGLSEFSSPSTTPASRAAGAAWDKAGGMAGEYTELVRRAKRAFVAEEQRRDRPSRVKEEIIRARGFKNIVLRSEDIAEFEYQPKACKRAWVCSGRPTLMRTWSLRPGRSK